MKRFSETWTTAAAFAAEYWRRVDGNSDAPVDELYVDDAVLHMGTAYCEGRARIRTFFEERRKGEIAARRTSRHVMSNLSIEFIDQGRIRVFSTVQVMAGVGDLPLAAGPIVTLADFEDVMREVAPDIWRIERRLGRVIFTGANASSYAR